MFNPDCEKYLSYSCSVNVAFTFPLPKPHLAPIELIQKTWGLRRNWLSPPSYISVSSKGKLLSLKPSERGAQNTHSPFHSLCNSLFHLMLRLLSGERHCNIKAPRLIFCHHCYRKISLKWWCSSSRKELMGQVHSSSGLGPEAKCYNDKQNYILHVAVRNQVWHLVIFYFLGSAHVLRRGALAIFGIGHSSCGLSW